MSESKEKIGLRIKAARKAKKLKQSDIADALGVTNKAVCVYETGVSNVTPTALAIISRLVGRSLEWLITGKEPASEPEKKPEITYPLAETEKNALSTAESIIERFGLNNRFQVVEIHHPPVAAETMTADEQRLLKAFRKLDERRQERLVEDAEDMVLARKESHENGDKGGGLADVNCA